MRVRLNVLKLVQVDLLKHRFTADLFVLCSEFFEVFKVVKPITSKPANSEVYVVGRGFMTSACREKFAKKYGAGHGAGAGDH